VDWQRVIRLLSATGFAMSVILAGLAFGLLAGVNYGACSTTDLLLKLGPGAVVLALHRLTRAFGRSTFFTAGFILAVSVLLFSGLKLAPFNLCI
jgi:hypothetical protein